MKINASAGQVREYESHLRRVRKEVTFLRQYIDEIMGRIKFRDVKQRRQGLIGLLMISLSVMIIQYFIPDSSTSIPHSGTTSGATSRRYEYSIPGFWTALVWVSIIFLSVTGIILWLDSFTVKAGFDKKLLYRTLLWGSGPANMAALILIVWGPALEANLLFGWLL